MGNDKSILILILEYSDVGYYIRRYCQQASKQERKKERGPINMLYFSTLCLQSLMTLLSHHKLKEDFYPPLFLLCYNFLQF